MIKLLKRRKKELYEMSRIGYIGNYELYINTDDKGNIPHFHFRDAKNWKKFHTCIKIESAEYFFHGNKQSFLNSSQRKELNEFMNQKNIRLNMTNYERISVLWDENNSKMEVKVKKDKKGKIIIPNYSNLK